MPSQFPASVGWIQGDAEDATFKRPESDGLANGVGGEGVPIASGGKVSPGWPMGPNLHSSVTRMSAYLLCINFLRDRRKTRDKPDKFDQDEGSTLHVERR